jgi:SNF2 family DNA or RNA helicase
VCVRTTVPEVDGMDKTFLESFYRAEACVGTKVARLLQEIQAMIEADETSKCVVFSQYAEVLDIAAIELQSCGIQFRGIYGNRRQHERADALVDFQTDSDVKVILLSLRGGAAGLNLTSANVCVIMDVAQNPALEEQAIDRIHRL